MKRGKRKKATTIHIEEGEGTSQREKLHDSQSMKTKRQKTINLEKKKPDSSHRTA